MGREGPYEHIDHVQPELSRHTIEHLPEFSQIRAIGSVPLHSIDMDKKPT